MKKICNFLNGSIFLPNVRQLVVSLIQPIVKWHPTEILKCLLPKICECTEKILNTSDINQINDHKGDLELNWNLTIFSELLRARGDTLLIYRDKIKHIFYRCIPILHKDSYQAMATSIKNLLKSMLNIYPTESCLIRENFDDSFIHSLPIRVSSLLVCFFIINRFA